MLIGLPCSVVVSTEVSVAPNVQWDSLFYRVQHRVDVKMCLSRNDFGRCIT